MPIARAALVLMLLVVALLQNLSPAAAHPLDAIFHDVRLRVSPGAIRAEVYIVVGPLVAPRIWDEADRDDDRAIDSEEAAAWGERYLSQMAVAVNARAVPLALQTAGIAFPPSRTAFVSGADSRIKVQATASVPRLSPGEHTLRIDGSAYAEISAYDFKARGADGLVVREASSISSRSGIFPLLVKETVRRSATPAASVAETLPAPDMVARAGAKTPVAPETDPGEAEGPQNLANRIGDSQLVAHLRVQEFSPDFLLVTLLAALLFGALHALQPGHGKTLVAAYLVGSRGTVRHAIALGAIVTFTHTASVLMLGVLLLAFSETIKPERILPGLTAASGVLVTGLGLSLLHNRLRDAFRQSFSHDRGRSPDHHAAHDHSHGQHHYHHHGHHDGYGHQHPTGHSHSHALPERITLRSLVALGVSGGIVPCTEALVILIVAVTIGQLLLGLLMIVAFSAGLAGILISIGVALVTMGGRLRRRMPAMPWITHWLPVASAALVIALGAALAWQGLNGL